MAARLTRPLKQYAQPRGALLLDRSNQLARSITHCIPFNGVNQEIVSGTRLTLGTGYVQQVDSRGISGKSAGSAACASVPLNLSNYSKLTLSFWLYWDVFANTDNLAMEFTSTIGSNSGFLVDPSSGAPSSGLFQFGVGPSAGDKSFARPTAAAWHHYAVIFNRPTVGGVDAVWVDGVAQTLSADAIGTNTGNFANDTLYFFSRNNASLFGAGRLQNVVIRGGYSISAAEVASEYANPWQIYKARSVPPYVVSASTSLTPGTSALALTGLAPTVAQPHAVNPAAGSLTLTGLAPSISQPLAVNPGVGALALTGFAPTLAQTANQAVAPAVGALSLTGFAPAVTSSAGQNVSPAVGALVLTGFAPAIGQTANQSVGPAAGVLSLVGQVPTIAQSVNQAITPDVCLLTVTGFAPGITQLPVGSVNVTPDTGTLTITGYAPDLTQTGAGGAGEYPKKRRYVTKINGQLVVIPDPSVLDLLHEEPEPVKVPVKEIKAKAKVYNLDKEMAALLKAEKYEQALKLHEELQDEEDIEMLLLAL